MSISGYSTGLLLRVAVVASLALAGLVAACTGPDDELVAAPAAERQTSEDPSLPGGPLPGGTELDEQFPEALNKKHAGPETASYTNTVVNYRQLRARVKQGFADDKIGGHTDAFFASKITLLHGAYLVTHFSEVREASSDFLLAVDGIAKDARERAATNKTESFAGENPEGTAAGGEDALIAQLYRRLLDADHTFIAKQRRGKRAATNDATILTLKLCARELTSEDRGTHDDVVDWRLNPLPSSALGGEQRVRYEHSCAFIEHSRSIIRTLPCSRCGTAATSKRSQVGRRSRCRLSGRRSCTCKRDCTRCMWSARRPDRKCGGDWDTEGGAGDAVGRTGAKRASAAFGGE